MTLTWAMVNQRYVDPKKAADPALNGNCALHPGAAKYYKEAGLLK